MFSNLNVLLATAPETDIMEVTESEREQFISMMHTLYHVTQSARHSLTKHINYVAADFLLAKPPS